VGYRDDHGNTVLLEPPFKTAGEASISKLSDRPDRVAKIYTDPPTPAYRDKLRWMRDHPPADPNLASGHASVSWPEGLLDDEAGALAGYVMPFVGNAVSIFEVLNVRYRARRMPHFHRGYLYRTARNLAAAIELVHARDYVIGDVNQANVLVTPAARVTLIDTDSFQVTERRREGDVIHRCPVGVPDYTPPELQGRPFADVDRTSEHDRFGLAVLIFQLLTEGNHPFRSLWLATGDPPMLGEKIRLGYFPYAQPRRGPAAPPSGSSLLDDVDRDVATLFLRCFANGHDRLDQRPSASEWARVLEAAESQLVQCAHGHAREAHRDHCSECAAANLRPPIPMTIPAQHQGSGAAPAAPAQPPVAPFPVAVPPTHMPPPITVPPIVPPATPPTIHPAVTPPAFQPGAMPTVVPPAAAAPIPPLQPAAGARLPTPLIAARRQPPQRLVVAVMAALLLQLLMLVHLATLPPLRVPAVPASVVSPAARLQRVAEQREMRLDLRLSRGSQVAATP